MTHSSNSPTLCPTTRKCDGNCQLLCRVLEIASNKRVVYKHLLNVFMQNSILPLSLKWSTWVFMFSSSNKQLNEQFAWCMNICALVRISLATSFVCVTIRTSAPCLRTSMLCSLINTNAGQIYFTNWTITKKKRMKKIFNKNTLRRWSNSLHLKHGN